MLDIGFMPPEDMVYYWIRSEEKPDFESGSSRPSGEHSCKAFSWRQIMVKSEIV